MTDRGPGRAPPRIGKPEVWEIVLGLAFVVFLGFSFRASDLSLGKLIAGGPNFVRLVSEMFPPSVDRLVPVLGSLLQTFQMAVTATFVGVLISLPLGVLAARSQSPHLIVYWTTRAFIALARTIPDLIWALFFVVMVGLGPFAGTLALIFDTMGFCGRFFAEAIEEVESGPQEALTALGATRLGVIASAVLPAALPSMINAALFSLERATRASLVLGIVGAGGIGMELKVSLDLFNYPQAMTTLIVIFVLVGAVEWSSGVLRHRVLGSRP